LVSNPDQVETTVRNSTTPLLSPLQQELPAKDGRFKVSIYDNDTTPFDSVVRVLMESTGCDVQEAYIETWEAQTYGKSDVHFAGEPACHAVAAIIGTVGVKTEVSKEWDD
jgi:ATP-dependent Clp protease adaptor protein ClpS